MAVRPGKLKLRNDGEVLHVHRDDDPTKGYRLGVSTLGRVTRSRYVFQFPSLVAPSAAVAVGTFDFVLPIPEYMTGHEVLTAWAEHETAGTGSGDTLVQIIRRRAASDALVLSQAVSIEPTETHSDDSATQPVVDVANDDLQPRDRLLIQVTQIPDGTAPKGLSVWIETEEP